MSLAPIEESLRFLISGNVDYELRTTLVEPLHDEASIRDMAAWLENLVPGHKADKLFLQSFVDRDTVLFSGLSAPNPEAVEKYAAILAGAAGKVTIRNK